MTLAGLQTGGNRLLWLDIARTVALVGMVVFHFVRDMEVFGMIAPGTTLSGEWAIFARGIAGSFLFLSGISLVLAHADGFKAKVWMQRFLLIVSAACVVSLVTYALFAPRFVYFGILHAIAAASIAGVPFLFGPAWMSLVGAALVLLAYMTVGGTVFASGWMDWTGLSTQARASLDFIPLVPWLAPFLLGIGLAKVVDLRRFEPSWPHQFPTDVMAWPGRHSLAVYLLHQPVLLALVWAGAAALQ